MPRIVNLLFEHKFADIQWDTQIEWLASVSVCSVRVFTENARSRVRLAGGGGGGGGGGGEA